MNFEAPTLDLPLRPVPAPLPLWRATVDAQQWSVAALEVALGGGRLVALWAAVALSRAVQTLRPTAPSVESLWSDSNSITAPLIRVV